MIEREIHKNYEKGRERRREIERDRVGDREI